MGQEEKTLHGGVEDHIYISERYEEVSMNNAQEGRKGTEMKGIGTSAQLSKT